MARDIKTPYSFSVVVTAKSCEKSYGAPCDVHALVIAFTDHTRRDVVACDERAQKFLLHSVPD